MQKTLLMLLISSLTIVCFFGVQTISYLMDGSPLSINLVLEEESESSRKEESEIKVELQSIDYATLIIKSNLRTATAYHNHSLAICLPYIEVVTPPPRS